ncbi:MAG: 50S ribosomal protein L11 methyltransferase [Legionellales bacterium]|nr:50S ribosomal protein L11 methyltransferase [Legionellales bacterium]
MNTYPPARITAMFIEHLLEKNLLENKIITDIGAGCFALGILAVQNEAKQSIGTDISVYALACARRNITMHGVKDKIILL